MIPFLGRTPDRPEWHCHPHFDPDLAKLMLRVYGELENEVHRPSTSRMDEVRESLPSFREYTQMAVPQRFALASLHCQLAFGGKAGERAESVLPCARKLAKMLDDPLALAECDFLEGWCHQERKSYTDAARSFESAVDRLRQLREADASAGDLALELRALSELAVHSFLQAKYFDADRYVEQGLALNVVGPSMRAPRAMLLWVRALLQRWRGNLEDALSCCV